MKQFELVFQNLVDELQTATDLLAFRAIGDRVARKLGFRWIAYLGFKHETPTLVSTYSRDWTNHYFAERYEIIDPVLRRARREHRLFFWEGPDSTEGSIRAQRRFFGEAADFEIRSGLTIPIRSGYDSFAAFTLATDTAIGDRSLRLPAVMELLQMVGLYFHTHIEANLVGKAQTRSASILSQRETQCLRWAEAGKTMAETANILNIATRTVELHLQNAREKIGACNVTQTVATAIRRGWVP